MSAYYYEDGEIEHIPAKPLQRIDLDDEGSFIQICPNFLTHEQSQSLSQHLVDNSHLRPVPMGTAKDPFFLPRLQGWMAERYKKVSLYQKTPPDEWTLPVLSVKKAIEDSLDNVCIFDFVLFNQYRDGNDKIGFHRDDESEGYNSAGYPKNIIASLSLGATRKFIFKSKKRNEEKVFELTDGYLVIMNGDTQTHWLHAVPAQPEVRDSRINLTFRVA